MTQQDKELCEAAVAAMGASFAPYSRFNVGAAVRTVSGEIYSGCNIEISSFGLTICAERVAVFKAVSEGFREFSSIVITSSAPEFCPPCGACRQVLADFSLPDSKVILLRPDRETLETTVRELLPHAFDCSYLNRGAS